jgi:hypothetical protein
MHIVDIAGSENLVSQGGITESFLFGSNFLCPLKVGRAFAMAIRRTVKTINTWVWFSHRAFTPFTVAKPPSL